MGAHSAHFANPAEGPRAHAGGNHRFDTAAGRFAGQAKSGAAVPAGGSAPAPSRGANKGGGAGPPAVASALGGLFLPQGNAQAVAQPGASAMQQAGGTATVPAVSTTAGHQAPASVVLGQQPGAPNNIQFHGDPQHSGFNSVETVLNPSKVASSLGQVWQSPQLDGAIYATPLYLDSLLISGPGNAANHSGDGVQSSSFQNQTLGVVFAATGGGTVYAIAAQDTDGPTGIAPGTILWKTHLGNPYAGVDGNSIGVLSTPIIDLQSGRLYVTASVADYLSAPGNPNHGGNNFEVFALSLHDGGLVSGWPLIYTQSLLDSLNQNQLQGPGIAVPFSSSGADQRGALNLSADGSTLYVDWACYGASNPGWLTTVATGVTHGAANGQTPAIVSAYWVQPV
jgi:hypothetical protein